MTITLIILAYVASVFLNRWLNKIIFKRNIDPEPSPFLWFIPLMVTLVFLYVLIENDNSKFTKWFTGKHW